MPYFPAITVGAGNSVIKPSGFHRGNTHFDFPCNGINDEVQLIKAIGEANSRGVGIELSDGTFTLSSPVTFVSTMTLEGQGIGVTTIGIASDFTSGAILRFTNLLVDTAIDSITIRNLTIDGSGADAGTGLFGHATNVILENVEIINCWQYGVNCRFNWDGSASDGADFGVHAKNVPLNNNGRQAGGENQWDCSVVRSSLENVHAISGGKSGIWANPAIDTTFDKCIADGNVASGFGIEGSASARVKYINNTSQNNSGASARGFSFIDAIIHLTLKNNLVFNNGGTGIRIGGGSTETVSYCSVEGNTVINNGASGGGEDDGIQLGADGVGNRIENNIVVNPGSTQDIGIRLEDSVEAVVQNNTVQGNDTSEIVNNSSGTVMFRNNLGSIIDGTISDPGDSNAIPANISGHVPLVSGGSGETRTIADAVAPGITRDLYFKTDGGGDIVITAASPVNQTGNTILTFADVGDHIRLTSIEDGSDFEWRVVANDGVALS